MILSFDYYMIKKDMLETYTVQELYLRGMPIPYIIGVTNKHRDDIEVEIAEVIEDRAKYSLSKVDLTPFQNEVKSVKRLITALYIIRNELYRRTQYIQSNLEMLTNFEKIDNIVKKARLNPSVEWVPDDFDEVSIVEETGGYLTVNEIYTIENSKEKDMIDYANVLLTKLLLKPDSIKSIPNDVADKDYHIRECNKLGLDPYKTTAKDLEREKAEEAIMEDYRLGRITDEEQLRLFEELNKGG